MAANSGAFFHADDEMARKATNIRSGWGRPWTKEDVRTLKTLAHEETKTTVIARKLKRSVGAMYRLASKLGVMGKGA
jgi:hypothetical protein